jgi:hypothetical protein
MRIKTDIALPLVRTPQANLGRFNDRE